MSPHEIDLRMKIFFESAKDYIESKKGKLFIKGSDIKVSSLMRDLSDGMSISEIAKTVDFDNFSEYSIKILQYLAISFDSINLYERLKNLVYYGNQDEGTELFDQLCHTCYKLSGCGQDEWAETVFAWLLEMCRDSVNYMDECEPQKWTGA